MAEEVTFFHNPRSRASIVHWMLEEVGAPYRLVPISFETGENRAPAFLAINPMGKLPTIQHRGVTVTETPAILAYLADAFPAAGLAPAPDDPQRGPYYRWLVFGSAAFEPALTDVLMKRPEVNRAMAGWGSYEDVLATLRGVLGTASYVAGERFTAADLFLSAQLGWAGLFGAPGIKEEPVFEAYLARCRARPAFARTIGAASPG